MRHTTQLLAPQAYAAVVIPPSDLSPEAIKGAKSAKLTLEVLQGNESARRLYERVGFAGYQLDPAVGQAQFLQKWLS